MTLHAGQTRFFAPGQLHAGDRIACVGPHGTTTVTLPGSSAAATQGIDGWGGGGPQISVTVRPSGAVQVDCGTSTVSAAPRVEMPYVVGRNGLGLIRGTNTLARVRGLYGRGTASGDGGVCRVRWAGIGLVATFTGGSCAAAGRLTAATVTGPAWASLTGVRIGDSVAVMRYRDAGAKLLTRTGTRSLWRLGGTGKRLPRLVAVVDARGHVAALEIRTR